MCYLTTTIQIHQQILWKKKNRFLFLLLPSLSIPLEFLLPFFLLNFFSLPLFLLFWMFLSSSLSLNFRDLSLTFITLLLQTNGSQEMRKEKRGARERERKMSSKRLSLSLSSTLWLPNLVHSTRIQVSRFSLFLSIRIRVIKSVIFLRFFPIFPSLSTPSLPLSQEEKKKLSLSLSLKHRKREGRNLNREKLHLPPHPKHLLLLSKFFSSKHFSLLFLIFSDFLPSFSHSRFKLIHSKRRERKLTYIILFFFPL